MLVAGPAAAASLLGGTLAGLAGAGELSRSRGGTVTAQAVQTGEVSAPFCTSDRLQCVSFRAASTTLTGELQGTGTGRVGVWSAIENGQVGASDLEGVQLFTGTVAGCGSGSFAWALSGQTSGAPPFETQLRIIAGSGSGELSGISGRGSSSLSGTGPLTGTITFRVHCRS